MKDRQIDINRNLEKERTDKNIKCDVPRKKEILKKVDVVAGELFQMQKKILGHIWARKDRNKIRK